MAERSIVGMGICPTKRELYQDAVRIGTVSPIEMVCTPEDCPGPLSQPIKVGRFTLPFRVEVCQQNIKPHTGNAVPLQTP